MIKRFFSNDYVLTALFIGLCLIAVDLLTL